MKEPWLNKEQKIVLGVLALIPVLLIIAVQVWQWHHDSQMELKQGLADIHLKQTEALAEAKQQTLEAHMKVITMKLGELTALEYQKCKADPPHNPDNIRRCEEVQKLVQELDDKLEQERKHW